MPRVDRLVRPRIHYRYGVNLYGYIESIPEAAPVIRSDHHISCCFAGPGSRCGSGSIAQSCRRRPCIPVCTCSKKLYRRTLAKRITTAGIHYKRVLYPYLYGISSGTVMYGTAQHHIISNRIRRGNGAGAVNTAQAICRRPCIRIRTGSRYRNTTVVADDRILACVYHRYTVGFHCIIHCITAATAVGSKKLYGIGGRISV